MTMGMKVRRVWASVRRRWLHLRAVAVVAVAGVLSIRSVSQCPNRGFGWWCCWASVWPLAAGARQIDLGMRIDEKRVNAFAFLGGTGT